MKKLFAGPVALLLLASPVLAQQNVNPGIYDATPDTTPLELSASNGSLFRSLTANAICVAAVTGNVVGFMTYAQY